MAPRETIAVSTNGTMMSGVTTQAQRDALTRGEDPPYTPPKIDWKLKEVPMAESTSTFSETAAKTQADTLKRAAEDGTPFCEECAKKKAQATA